MLAGILSVAVLATPPIARGGPVHARLQDAPRTSGSAAPATPRAMPALERRPLRVYRIDSLLHSDVQDQAGGSVGRIDDLLVSPEGRIAYVVISGVGATESKDFPVPWGVIRVELPTGRTPPGATIGMPGAPAPPDVTAKAPAIVAPIDRNTLKTAPSFEKTRWPKDGETSIFNDASAFFAELVQEQGKSVGASPRDDRERTRDRVELGPPAMLRASKLVAEPVVDAAGNSLGAIEQLALDPFRGRINYAALSVMSGAGASGRIIATPWSALDASRQQDKTRIRLVITPERLQSAPPFESAAESWKQMSDPKWIQQMYAYYAVQPYWLSPEPPDRTSGHGGIGPTTPGGAPGKTPPQ
jgi:sporulation protein YlmC with PRC-barrel domain